jgi:hypothetical protein
MTPHDVYEAPQRNTDCQTELHHSTAQHFETDQPALFTNMKSD